MEAHPKLRPLDMATPGFYLCGLAQGPKFAGESVSQARGAVSRALAILSKKEIATEGAINRVDALLCRACGECEKNCSFEAIKVTQVDSLTSKMDSWRGRDALPASFKAGRWISAGVNNP